VFVNWAANKGMMHEAISDTFSTDQKICLAYYYNLSPDARETIVPWISESLKSDKGFVLKCVAIDPLILNYCKNNEDFEVLRIAVCNCEKDQVDTLARTALENGWADALTRFAKTLRIKVEAHWAMEAFGDHPGARRYFARAPAVKRLIGSYLGIVPDAGERRQLKAIWKDRSIFFLALGGSVSELCVINKFRTKRKRQSGYSDWLDDSESDASDDDCW
jgi:hypothetical protein